MNWKDSLKEWLFEIGACEKQTALITRKVEPYVRRRNRDRIVETAGSWRLNDVRVERHSFYPRPKITIVYSPRPFLTERIPRIAIRCAGGFCPECAERFEEQPNTENQ